LLPIIWRSSAREDLAQILRYIAQANPQAARRMRHLLEEAVLPLSQHPYLYRSSERVPGLRELVAHPNYLVLYRVGATRIEVVPRHGARAEQKQWFGRRQPLADLAIRAQR